MDWEGGAWRGAQGIAGGVHGGAERGPRTLQRVCTNWGVERRLLTCLAQEEAISRLGR